jgi:hypothetical protein
VLSLHSLCCDYEQRASRTVNQPTDGRRPLVLQIMWLCCRTARPPGSYYCSTVLCNPQQACMHIYTYILALYKLYISQSKSNSRKQAQSFLVHSSIVRVKSPPLNTSDTRLPQPS